jgi:hypothetical protein
MDNNDSGYANHAAYMARVDPEVRKRVKAVEDGLRQAFGDAIRKEEIEVIVFSDMKPETLADAIAKYPIVLKPLLTICNLAARAIERDLMIKNLDTYKPRLSREQALMIAGLIKPYLPPTAPIPALSHVDRIEFIDKEIRKHKGQWEQEVCKALNGLGQITFKKKTFRWQGDTYEIDAAAPDTGPTIKYAVDIKRIEARRDIHKRSDEIVNKADKFKRVFPEGVFGAVIYYPFPQEHSNIQDRLRSTNITSVVFASASEESILNAVALLLGKYGILKRENIE